MVKWDGEILLPMVFDVQLLYQIQQNQTYKVLITNAANDIFISFTCIFIHYYFFFLI